MRVVKVYRICQLYVSFYDNSNPYKLFYEKEILEQLLKSKPLI